MPVSSLRKGRTSKPIRILSKCILYKRKSQEKSDFKKKGDGSIFFLREKIEPSPFYLFTKLLLLACCGVMIFSYKENPHEYTQKNFR